MQTFLNSVLEHSEIVYIYRLFLERGSQRVDVRFLRNLHKVTINIANDSKIDN